MDNQAVRGRACMQEQRSTAVTGEDQGFDRVVNVVNPRGAGGFVLVCEHASNFIPPELGNLGLADDMLLNHIVWDPGAAAVAQALSAQLDAPLVMPRVSRLVYRLQSPAARAKCGGGGERSPPDSRQCGIVRCRAATAGRPVLPAVPRGAGGDPAAKAGRKAAAGRCQHPFVHAGLQAAQPRTRDRHPARCRCEAGRRADRAHRGRGRVASGPQRAVRDPKTV